MALFMVLLTAFIVVGSKRHKNCVVVHRVMLAVGEQFDITGCDILVTRVLNMCHILLLKKLAILSAVQVDGTSIIK